jgi:uncharacterized protein
VTAGDRDRDRDRDPAGRARSARPRDGLGRPLPRDAAGSSGSGGASGSGGSTGSAGAVERVPDDLVLPPLESLAEAQRLLDAGRPFHAHEVLEGTWKAAPEHERELWQGLAQLAVGLTHRARGNPVGAARLLERGATRVAAYSDEAPYGIDVTRLVDAARRIAAEPLTDGEPPRTLRLRVNSPPD